MNDVAWLINVCVVDIMCASNCVYRELVVRLEMVAESQGTEFKKVDSGPLR